MSESLQFLDLPPELILQCLTCLPFRDLASCLNSGNRLLHGLIVNSVLIRYRLEQERAAVEENPSWRENTVISDRLADLRARESNWLNFTPKSTRRVPIDFQTTGIYDLAPDIYFVGDQPDPTTQLCTGLKYIYTSPGPEASQWHRIDAGAPVIDFGTSLEEHDLIAMVTYTAHEGNAQMRSVDVVLLKFSTGEPHPLAKHPTLHIHDASIIRGKPGIAIEIVGQNLALSLVYWGDDERDLDIFHLYNWKLGSQKMAPLGVSNTALAFLTTDTVIVPNSLDASLDVFRIPDSDEGSPPRFLHSFNLPELADDTAILSFQCRGDPNPRAALSRPTRSKFIPRPENALMLFSCDIGNQNGGMGHMFVLDRALFTGMLEVCPSNVSDIQWEAWGPQCTRWFDTNALSTHYITTTCGQRLVTISNNAWQKPAPIRVLDFNNLNVLARRTLGPGRVQEEHATIRIVPEDEEMPPDDIDPAPFRDPVRSFLPFIETVSEELYDFGAVIINDQNIIGVKFGETSLGGLEVFHFG
ncbi:hypothetical protein C8R44DRAFT_857810 [Mycena epipterygia]|nr:hypothetical protein C8R44DRAFT_857810 [Mycena epipterygia]